MINSSDVLRILGEKGIEADTSQVRAITAMVDLLEEGFTGSAKTWWWNRRAPCAGVYCHGLPGRGKSIVVDEVYSLVKRPKIRIHYHEFLKEIRLRQMREGHTIPDPLVAASTKWLTGIELLCFDEFHVHDIADAFLIGRFLQTAICLRLPVFLTSNYAPGDLLPDPQFHQRFVSTIETIESTFRVIHFDGPRDYRSHSFNSEPFSFLSTLSGNSRIYLQLIFHHFETCREPRRVTLDLARRALTVQAQGKDIIWVEFSDLCVSQRSHLDYLELADRCSVLIVDNLSIKSLAVPSTLQRFIWLIDIFYDRHFKMFIASDGALGKTMLQAAGAYDLARTVSRLAQMSGDALAFLQKCAGHPTVIAEHDAAQR
jgi:cell division protein ZapE